MRRDAAVAGCALLLGLAWLGLSYTDPADRPTTPLGVELTAAVVAVLVTLLRRRHSVAVVIPAVCC